jgi:hypothetical protein
MLKNCQIDGFVGCVPPSRHMTGNCTDAQFSRPTCSLSVPPLLWVISRTGEDGASVFGFTFKQTLMCADGLAHKCAELGAKAFYS